MILPPEKEGTHTRVRIYLRRFTGLGALVNTEQAMHAAFGSEGTAKLSFQSMLSTQQHLDHRRLQGSDSRACSLSSSQKHIYIAFL